MPANRVVPLVERESLGGPFFVLTFRHPEVAGEAEPGQFVMIKAGSSAEPPLRRPFSILSVDPPAGTFALFVKDVGQGSHALCALAPGATAQCLGPLGTPFALPPQGVEALLVAGGYGVAPFRFTAERWRGTGRPPTLFYGGRSARDLPLLGQLRGLGLAVVPTTEDGTLGEHGRVTGPLELRLDSLGSAAKLYACGPTPMLRAVARIAERRGLLAEVSLDPWMGCGVGTCLGCVVRVQAAQDARPRYRCACTDGPVFDAARVVWPDEDSSRARRCAGGSVDAEARR